MDIRAEILKEHSKQQTVRLRDYIGDSQELFDELMHVFFTGEYRETQRAAWIVSHCVEMHPDLIQPHLEKMIHNLEKPNLHDAIKRNTLRILQLQKSIPEDLQGYALDYAFDYLSSQKENIAIKVFSMQTIFNICKTMPDMPELLEELKVLIEDQMPYGSAGFKSRGKKILKGIKEVLEGKN